MVGRALSAIFGNFVGAAFLIAGVVVLVLWPHLVVMAVIWIVLGVFFVGLGFRGMRRDTRKAQLLRSGKAATATVTAIRDTGTTINQNPRVELTLQVQPDDAPAFEVKSTRTVSRVALPRLGAAYSIRYDPESPEDFAWDDSTPAVSVTRAAPIADGTPPSNARVVEDPLDRLEKLADLKAKGVLTEVEFEAEKAKILRES
jgi:uncharacterized protein DUF3592/putative oligomerization/nucleic acid binding protein